MLIPIRTDIARRRPTLITYWIMALCIGMFLVSTVLEQRAPDTYARFFSFMALHGDFTHGVRSAIEQDAFDKFEGRNPLGWMQKLRLDEVNPAQPWQYITYQFMHGSWMHLLGNMLFLWVFGPVVEDRLRRWWFLGFYLAAGAFAGFVHTLFEGRVIDQGFVSGLFYIPVIGASGSIAGVTGAFLILFPQSRIDIIWFLGIIGRFAIPAWWFIGLAIARDFVFQAVGSGGVAHMAHLGGYIFGATTAFLCLWWKWIPREPYNLFTLGRQAHRRRAYREMVRSRGSGFVADAAKARVADAGDDERARRRTAVFDAVRSGNIEIAAHRYAALLEESPDEVLPRDHQIAIANHWFASGRHALAAKAYESLLAKYPEDRERHETALMLALISARYLNDPVRAAALLGGLDRTTLSEDHRALADTLRTEII